MNLPPFERKTLGRVIRGEDPFCGFNGTSGSRVYSQALARLQRKGFVEYGGGEERVSGNGRWESGLRKKLGGRNRMNDIEAAFAAYKSEHPSWHELAEKGDYECRQDRASFVRGYVAGLSAARAADVTTSLAALVAAACRWQEVVGNAQGQASGGNDARLEYDRRLGVLMQEIHLGYQALPEHLRPRAFEEKKP